MATNGEDTAAVNTPFPNPPSFWQSFTADNVAAYQALEAQADGAVFDVPAELADLQPPAAPASGQYTIFAETRSLDTSLEKLPGEVSSLDPASGTRTSPQHLLNLTRSLLLSYMETLHVLSLDPSPPNYGAKWGDLRDLFHNTHHGLNTYRPWQARDALIKLLEQTRDNALAEIESVKGLRGRVDEVLENVHRNCEEAALKVEDREERNMEATNGIQHPNVDGMNGHSHQQTEETVQRELWDLLAEGSEES